MKNKSTRGRRAGQFGKAHKSVQDEVRTIWEGYNDAQRRDLLAKGITAEVLKDWRHSALAANGNFPREVQSAAFNLGKLVREYKRILNEKRCNLECNRRGVEIPLPYLPQAEYFDEKELNQIVHGSGHDVIWIMQRFGYIDAFRLLSSLIRAAANNDTVFFKEFSRRVSCGVPLESPAEPVYSAMTSLKTVYERETWDRCYRGFYEKDLPSFVSILKLPLGKRPPLKLAQIADYIRVFGRQEVSSRALSRMAKIMGIPVAPRGRTKSGT
jgi:hypothetical protein